MSTITSPAKPPGLAVEVDPVKPGVRSALRSDVAGFIGRTRRGPLGIGEAAKPCRVRVQGQRGFNTIFSPTMLQNAITPYAVNGYFENEGDVAHVIRVGGPASSAASGFWDLSRLLAGGSLELNWIPALSRLDDLPTSGRSLVVIASFSEVLYFRIFDQSGARVVDTNQQVLSSSPANLDRLKSFQTALTRSHLSAQDRDRIITDVASLVGWGILAGGFLHSRFHIVASSPGAWANDAQVTLTYSREGVSGTPAVDLTTQVAGETTETIRGIDPETFADQINATSSLIRVRCIEASALPRATGLNVLSFTQTLTLGGGFDDPPSVENYLDAIESMGDEPEVALIVMPDLYHDVIDSNEQLSILASAVALADSRQDRLVIVDVPPGLSTSKDVISWTTELQTQCVAASNGLDPDTSSSCAVYHPWLWVSDPLGTTPEESRILIPPSGHVAGLISRLDRQRGAHYTPANAPLLQTFDVAGSFRPSDRAVLNDAGVNLIRDFPNQGLLVWGGRTLGTQPGDLFVAHRRLIHRLVRSIRAVAEPLVFDLNGPELRLTLVRSITSLLLQVYRAGGLAGATPDQAFQVQCDDQTNPPDAFDTGQLVCEVNVAPAIPMEFILLRISLDTEGRLEVLQ